jgi:hypothetical protein
LHLGYNPTILNNQVDTFAILKAMQASLNSNDIDGSTVRNDSQSKLYIIVKHTDLILVVIKNKIVSVNNQTTEYFEGPRVEALFKAFGSFEQGQTYYIVRLKDDNFRAYMRDEVRDPLYRDPKNKVFLMDHGNFRLLYSPTARSSGKSHSEKRKMAIEAPSLFNTAGGPRNRPRTQNPTPSINDADYHRKPHHRKGRRDPSQYSQHSQQVAKPKKGKFSLGNMFGRKEHDGSKHRGDEKHSRRTQKNEKPQKGQSSFSRMFGLKKSRGSNHRSHTEHERLL